MASVLQPLADALGVGVADLALLLGLLLGTLAGWALRGRGRSTGPVSPPLATAAHDPLPFPVRGVHTTSVHVLGEEGSREVDALLAAGQAIDAIKRVRELTGLGLKEAKDFVDALRRARG